MSTKPEAKMKERLDYITKSENDDRLYRGLILNNGIKVLLISDPTTDKAATALDVNIGFMSDPNDLPGLAHLLQHVLYLSDENSTLQHQFKEYVLRNNGVVNAKTTDENTNYHFDIDVSKFKRALELFAQLFSKKPLFTETMINSELEHINAERAMCGKKDKLALNQLFKWTIDSYHPISKFGITFSDAPDVSNIFEPNVDVIKKCLYLFYDKHYFSNLMSLCVLSKENLDELEELVVQHFSELKSNKDLHEPLKFRPCWREPKCSSVYKIWAVNPLIGTDCKRLYIIFPANNLMYYHQSASASFLTYLFEYAGNQSLISVIKDKGWGNSIEAGTLCTAFKFFTVAVALTDKGLEHVDNIVSLFLQYTKMLKENGGSELRRIYNEYKEIMLLKFRFKEKEPSLKYVKIVSRMLHIHTYQTMKDVLCLEYIPIHHKQFNIQRVLEGFLSPLRMRIYIIAQKYQNITNEIEPWYYTRYRREMVPLHTSANWWNNTSAILNLPVCNQFIPELTNCIKWTRSWENNNAKKDPTIIYDTQVVRVWYKKDDVFNKPNRTTMIFHFICPVARADALSANLTLMFVQLVNDSIKEYLYSAALVDLQWEFCATVRGILLKINSFTGLQYLISLYYILDQLINFKLNAKNFEEKKQIHRQFCKKQLEQFNNDQPYRQVQHYLSVQLKSHLFEKTELLKNIENVPYECVEKFVSNFFKSVFVECLIHGDVHVGEAWVIGHLIESKLPYVIQVTPTHLEMYDEETNYYHYLHEGKNKFHKSSCMQIFYQINERSTQSDVLLDLLQQIINKPCYDTLKIKEKLGYIACTGVHRTNNRKQGLTILVQTTKLRRHETETQINAFLHSMVDYIANISEKSFQRNKVLLAKSYHDKKPKTLNNLSDFYWAEIMNQLYNFDQFNTKVQYLDKVTTHDLSNFVEKLADKSTSKVTVYVTPEMELFRGKRRENKMFNLEESI